MNSVFYTQDEQTKQKYNRNVIESQARMTLAVKDSQERKRLGLKHYKSTPVDMTILGKWHPEELFTLAEVNAIAEKVVQASLRARAQKFPLTNPQSQK